MVSFTIQPIIGQMHNSTNLKEQKSGPVNALKKHQSIFFTFGKKKIEAKKIDDFLFLLQWH